MGDMRMIFDDYYMNDASLEKIKQILTSEPFNFQWEYKGTPERIPATGILIASKKILIGGTENEYTHGICIDPHAWMSIFGIPFLVPLLRHPDDISSIFLDVFYTARHSPLHGFEQFSEALKPYYRVYNFFRKFRNIHEDEKELLAVLEYIVKFENYYNDLTDPKHVYIYHESKKQLTI